jgi:hypothetical protein
MDAVFPIFRQGVLSEERGEFTGGAAPGQVHLKEAVLGVKETESTSSIVSISGLHGWHTQGVAFDSDTLRETGHLSVSVPPSRGDSENIREPGQQSQIEPWCPLDDRPPLRIVPGPATM